MSRSQDTVIDDDEETCPLCIEEFDLSDKNFRPCPCGYQICQFCFNSLKVLNDKSTCPNCRRPYDEKTIQYKIPTAEEFKLDQLNKNKKQAAAKRKETEKREVETSVRRNLAGVRVKQQNLVYVIGLIPSVKDEQSLLQTLRGPDYFGQYGEIEKIVVSKPKPGITSQGIGVYVTYARKEDAATCINSVDGSLNGDRVLRAQFGTTKYCSAFLRGEVCNNKNCSFLHETGEDGQNSSLQNESHGVKARTAPGQIIPPARPLSATQVTQPMARQSSKEDDNIRKDSSDGSALPTTASWANSNAPVARTRRASQANSRATPSPQMVHATPAVQKLEEPKPREASSQPSPASSVKKPSTKAQPPAAKPKAKPVDPIQEHFEAVLRSISPHAAFNYDDSCLSPEIRAAVADMPSFIDPYGGFKRRAMREREELERLRHEAEAKAKLEAQATSTAEDALDEDNMVAGSLALGGEPEDDPRSSSARGAIGRPSQTSDNARSLTPQRQQLAFLNAGGSQAPGLGQNTAFEMSDFDRRGPQYSQAQYEQISNHQRHGSRYFNNDAKASTASRFQSAQSSFYSSGVQGPPPGLPTAGTPPVSGGGMFAHGQNFTNPGFGASKDTNAEIFSRNRSGTNQGHEISKLDEKNFPPLPLRLDTQPTPLHSRVSSHHSLGSGARSSTPKIPPGFERISTPKIPPGFELSHAHPPLSRHESPSGSQAPTQRSISRASGAIAPAVPLVPLGPRSSTPQTKLSETPKEDPKDADTVEISDLHVHKRGNEASEISLGSPKLRPTRTKETVPDLSVKSEGTPAKNKESPSKSPATKGKGKDSSQKSGMTGVPASPAAATAGISTSTTAPEKSATPILDSSVAGTPGTMSPQAPTPVATTPSEASKPSVSRPRTLRLTTGSTSKVAEQLPAVVAAEKASAFPPISAGKKGSRRPSLASIQHSRPSTPAVSERPSHDASRASSPPPSIVGSAPERNKSKAQQKKDRKEKAKKVSEVTESASTSTTPAIEEVAPVIARQKKQKKKADNNTPATVAETKSSKQQEPIEKPKADSVSRKTPVQIQEKDQLNAVAKAERVVPSPTPSTPQEGPEPKVDEHVQKPYMLRDLYNEAAKAADRGDNSGTTIQKLLNEHVSPTSKIIQSMIQSGDLTKDHPWLNPPSFTNAAYKLPPDSRRGQEYLDANGYSATAAFGYVYLPLKEKQALRDSQAVSVADAGDRANDVLKRCLVTPNGWVLRHLSADEEAKVLELEERRQMYMEEFGDVGTMTGLGVLEADDFVNLGGGMDRLSRHGERHGVVWVMGEGEGDMGEDDEFEPFDGEDGELDGEIGFSEDDEEVFEDDGLEDDAAEGSFRDHVNMPGAWDNPPRPASGRVTSLPGLGPHSKTTAPLRMPGTTGPQGSSALRKDGHAGGDENTGAGASQTGNVIVNLRALDHEALQRRVAEKHKEMEASKKNMEKLEKMWNKKSKDIGRYRETLVKG
ncbi:uncharacterized protein PV06_06614 [Exophiala oligosperma]|uniref:RING-type domain-containing protein n=1 Tax=Exophiala oligosperma TaxID=215243 RepID=A0A0D2AM62_9EURO|nr:uncharacterized protein PV06_06614 [Exophiala oligosperma]KIW41016.1 hypothetical protein PV06_06614 [Exophiala oligosperma]